MTYKQAIEYIDSRLAFGIKPGLDRMYKLLSRLGNPHEKLNIIHVAGTNGKGSICAYLASTLKLKHKAVGLYTSPAITDLREQLQINGKMISQSELAQCVDALRQLIDDSDEITQFELITCIAFYWFFTKGCDIVILETGMGGLEDATNVITKPLCSVISHIDIDHTGVLGSTLAQIAGQKAGIIKPGAPVVVTSSQSDEAMQVIKEKADSCQSPLIIAEECAVNQTSFTHYAMSYRDFRFESSLIGQYQAINAGVAIEVLRQLDISDDTIRAGLSSASLPARMEVISKNPLIIIDGAHNPNGAEALSRTLSQLFPQGNTVALMGILADKDYHAMLDSLLPYFEKVITADGYSVRELSSRELCEIIGDKAICGGNVTSALASALSLADGKALIICGSLYLAAAVKRALRQSTL